MTFDYNITNKDCFGNEFFKIEMILLNNTSVKKTVRKLLFFYFLNAKFKIDIGNAT